MISLSDGRWFDESKAEKFEEASDWDGSNSISIATGSQWEHERLWRTEKGTWVLNCWSQRQGTIESYIVYDDDHAAWWLSVNNHTHPDLSEELAELEI